MIHNTLGENLMGIRSYLKSRSQSVNPYYSTAELLLSRLNWDIHPQSWTSRQRIKKWRNQYAGEKAVILCNGPSLLKVDLSKLSNVFTFGLNKINLIFDKSEFRPSCIVAVNPFVLEQNRNFYNRTEIPLFLDGKGVKFIKHKKNICFMHSTLLRRFAKDCSVSVYQGCTVTFVAMQLAYHMGFKKVALVGADHDFKTKGVANKTVVSGDQDENHFDKNYFAGGVEWQLPDLVGSEISYLLAREEFIADKREIFNATEGGKLEIFRRMSLDDFIQC